MKIAYLLGGFQGNGGIGRVTSILVNDFVKNSDIEVHTISFLQQNKPELYVLGNDVRKHHLFENSVSMTKAIFFKHAIRKLKKILIENDIDILICCGALFFPLGIFACRRISTKCICWEHTNPSISTDHKFQNLCRKIAVRKADALVVLTKDAEKYYVKKFPNVKQKIAQIYNPVDFREEGTVKYDENSTKIISVGRLSYPKNFERLISIASKILPTYPEWIWDIYGEGELRDSLQGYIDKQGLHDKITLKGQVFDLYSRYKDYAFMVMTSRYEGFPMSLLEGAYNGLPLLSFDIQTGPNEIIVNNENGYLINVERDEEMISKICLLIENSDLRKKLSREACKVKDKFNIGEIKREWIQLFDLVLRKAKV